MPSSPRTGNHGVVTTDSLRSVFPIDLVPSPPSGLLVIDSPGRGRGVAAARAFRRGEVLERAPVLLLGREVMANGLRGTRLDDYLFWWDDDHRAIALGWISLCNHACPANAAFRLAHAAQLIVLEAASDIGSGEEVTINYHGDPADPAVVWFPVR